MFRFKTFQLLNDRASFKINTDGVLLAAWLKLYSTARILEIGTGSGVIAFILSTRFPKVKIDAIDIDRSTIEECLENVIINSDSMHDFSNLSFHHSSLQLFTQNVKETYDHIVCNPPYFEGDTLSQGMQLRSAKHAVDLTLKELISHSQTLLSSSGQLHIIIPQDRFSDIEKLSNEYQMSISRVTYVKSRKMSKPHRVLIEIHNYNSQKIVEESTLTIHNDGQHNYTDEYINLTKTLYLKL